LTRQVLFVCTGNVFRSLTAEYALRAALHPRTEFLVASAGIDDRAQAVPPEIVDYLRQKNFDVSSHRRRTLTRQLVDAADVVIAMSLDHRDFIRVRFGRRVPVFLECCAHRSEALLDLHEAVSDYRTNQAAALAYIRTTIDRIVELTPLLACRIDTLLGDHPQP
jgi:protein-tyrosine-phosphatase